MPIETALFRPRRCGWMAGTLVAIVDMGIGGDDTPAHFTLPLFYPLPAAITAWLSGTGMAVEATALAGSVRDDEADSCIGCRHSWRKLRDANGLAKWTGCCLNVVVNRADDA